MSKSALVMPWGKYKGKPIEEVPNTYVLWLAENAKDERVCAAADKEMKYRQQWDIVIEEEWG